MAKFCGRCGTKLDELTGLCPNCDSRKTNSIPQQHGEDQVTHKDSIKFEKRDDSDELYKHPTIDIVPQNASVPALSKREAKKAAKMAAKANRSIGDKILGFFVKLVLIVVLLALLASAGCVALVYYDLIDVPVVENVLVKAGLKEATVSEAETTINLPETTSEGVNDKSSHSETVVGNQTDSDTSIDTTNTSESESIDTQIDYQPQVQVNDAVYFSSASASSVLPKGKTHTYEASNVLVNDDSCWCEGSSGYGEEEWIMLQLPEVQKLYGLQIINGYAGTEKQYQENGKPSEILIEFSDGQSTSVQLNVFSNSQRKTIQLLTFNTPIETSYVKITIKSVVKGECSDTCITYIAPYGNGR